MHYCGEIITIIFHTVGSHTRVGDLLCRCSRETLRETECRAAHRNNHFKIFLKLELRNPLMYRCCGVINGRALVQLIV